MLPRHGPRAISSRAPPTILSGSTLSMSLLGVWPMLRLCRRCRCLDLKGTWLVTLSACDTGSGEARAGEGVMGLRRGFIEAGAQNLLMTLWPISDEVTVQIMSDFYDAAHKTGNAPEALAEVQRKWLLKLRTEKGLAQAVNLAGPFIMSSEGIP